MSAVHQRTKIEFFGGPCDGHQPLVGHPIGYLKRTPDREIAAYCQVGQRGYLATRILRQSGRSAVNLGGGYKTYQLLVS